MKLHSLLALALTLAPAAPALAADEGKIEGTWTVVSLERSGQKVPDEQNKDTKITITADKLKVKMGDRDHEAEYKLDPSKKPATIDIVPLDGPEKGKTGYGIYSLKGDELKICFARPGRDRPTEFVSKPDSEVLLIVLKRAKP